VPWAAVVSTMLFMLGAPGPEPLEIAAVDASAFPTVVVEIVAPVGHTSERLTAAMVKIDGSPVESVTAVDAGDVVVGLVIDDRPTVSASVVSSLQGAAVELVRNTSDGIEVSLGTPSGLRTALTADRDANIARIAGITAGSPAVVPLSDAITATVAELASSEAADRHAVIVLGDEVELTDAEVTELRAALRDSGTALHVVVPGGVDAGALSRIARRSGGGAATSPALLAAIDGVTATISNRYRVVATVAEGGRHRIRLTVDAQPFSARFNVSEPAASSPPASSPSAPTPAERVQGEPATGTTPERTESPAPLDIAPPAGDGGPSNRAAVLGALALAVVLVGAGVGIAVRRRMREDEDEVIVKRPARAPTAAAPKTPTPARAPTAAAPKTPTPAPAPTASAPQTPTSTAPASSAASGESRTTRSAATPPSPASPRRAPERPGRTPPPRREPVSPAVTRPARTSAAPTPSSSDEAPEWIVAGDLRLSPQLGEVWSGQRRVELSATELTVLELLMTSQDRGVTREAILEAAELDDSAGSDAVDAIVTQVRRKAGIRRGHAVRKERVVTYFLD
jgi:hypothetical protein